MIDEGRGIPVRWQIKLASEASLIMFWNYTHTYNMEIDEVRTSSPYIPMVSPVCTVRVYVSLNQSLTDLDAWNLLLLLRQLFMI